MWPGFVFQVLPVNGRFRHGEAKQIWEGRKRKGARLSVLFLLPLFLSVPIRYLEFPGLLALDVFSLSNCLSQVFWKPSRSTNAPFLR
jgi:hypothetical protein